MYVCFVIIINSFNIQYFLLQNVFSYKLFIILFKCGWFGNETELYELTLNYSLYHSLHSKQTPNKQISSQYERTLNNMYIEYHLWYIKCLKVTQRWRLGPTKIILWVWHAKLPN